MKPVTVVIVTRNNCTMLAHLLEQLYAQSSPPDTIVVVDNASSDGTDRIVPKKFPSVRYKRLTTNTGSAGGYYTGFLEAMHEPPEFIWTLDDDVEPDTNALKFLVTGFEKLSSQGITLGAARSVTTPGRYTVPTPLYITPWRGTLFSAKAIAQVGLPNPDYFLYGEDLEYALRLRKSGYDLYWIPESYCPEKRQAKTNETFLGKPVVIYPTAFRLYYAFRNEYAICCNYGEWTRLARLLLYAVKVSVFLTFKGGTGRSERMKAVAAGLVDGMRNRLGSREHYTPS